MKTKKKTSKATNKIQTLFDKVKAKADQDRQEYINGLPEPTRSIYRTLGFSGRMMCSSKTLYSRARPRNVAIFNANVVVEACDEPGSFKKIWYGDLDLTVDEPKLKELATLLNAPIYVLREMDGRFENEVEPKVDQYAFKIKPGDGLGVTGPALRDFTERPTRGRLAKKLVYKKGFR